jgi:hypothetical protein
MLRSTIKPSCTSAYVALLVLLFIYIFLFTEVMHSQELPTAPRVAVKQQESDRRKLASPSKSQSTNNRHFYSQI